MFAAVVLRLRQSGVTRTSEVFATRRRLAGVVRFKFVYFRRSLIFAALPKVNKPICWCVVVGLSITISTRERSLYNPIIGLVRRSGNSSTTYAMVMSNTPPIAWLQAYKVPSQIGGILPI